MPSSVIRDYRYDPAKQRLDILFVSGRLYSYYDVPDDIVQAMRSAYTKGEYFNAHIRTIIGLHAAVTGSSDQIAPMARGSENLSVFGFLDTLSA